MSSDKSVPLICLSASLTNVKPEIWHLSMYSRWLWYYVVILSQHPMMLPSPPSLHPLGLVAKDIYTALSCKKKRQLYPGFVVSE